MEILRDIGRNLKKTKYSFKRFPIPMFFACIAAVLLMMIEDGGDYWREAFTVIFGFFATLFSRLFVTGFREKTSRSRTFSAIVYVMAALAILGIYFLLEESPEGRILDDGQSGYTYWGAMFSTIVACAFVAKLNNWDNYEAYILEIIYAEAVALLYTVVLGCGLSAILFAMNSLLGIIVSASSYTKVWILAVAPFQAGVFLANYPIAHGDTEKKVLNHTGVVLLRYIVTPILVVFSVILYLYFGKLMATGEMPVHTISLLVLSYGVVAVANLFFQSQIREEKFSRELIGKFPWVMLPLLLAFFYALFQRIGYYGLTENRYLGLLLGIWILFSVVYFIVKKGRDNLTLALVLCLTIIVATIGPSGAYHVAGVSQIKRLEKLLVKNQMLVDGKLVGKVPDNREDATEIYRILEYLDRHHDFKEVPFVPKTFKMDQMASVFGFDQKETKEGAGNHSYLTATEAPLEVTGYDKVYKGYAGVGFDFQTLGRYSVGISGGNFVVKTTEGKILYRTPLEDLFNKAVTFSDDGFFDKEDLSIPGEDGDFGFKVVLRGISMTYKDGKKTTVEGSVEYYLLTKEPKRK